MPQFFADRRFESGEEVEIAGREARHIAEVLRLRAGDWIVLSSGDGRSFSATILSSSPRRVVARAGEEIRRGRGAPPPALALSIIKGDRFEWAIQKAVELGVRRIIPFRSARTIPRLALDAGARRIERWKRIAIAAAKQSGLPFLPDVSPATKFQGLAEGFASFACVALFHEGEGDARIADLWGGTAKHCEDLIVIGPEGGFTGEEVEIARRCGARAVGLGAQILRVETAAIAAVAIWQHELGNMGGRR